MSSEGRVVKRARDILAAGAWTKGALELKGRYCALGALTAATKQVGHQGYWDAVGRVEGLVPAVYRERSAFSSITAFNDDPDTTLQDVLTVFDKALAELGELL